MEPVSPAMGHRTTLPESASRPEIYPTRVVAGGRRPLASRPGLAVAARRLWRVLSAGGGLLTLGEEPVPPDAGSLDAEYEAIYRRFGELVPRAASDVDVRPLQLVSDIFLVAKQIPVESFEDPLPG